MARSGHTEETDTSTMLVVTENSSKRSGLDGQRSWRMALRLSHALGAGVPPTREHFPKLGGSSDPLHPCQQNKKSQR